MNLKARIGATVISAAVAFTGAAVTASSAFAAEVLPAGTPVGADIPSNCTLDPPLAKYLCRPPIKTVPGPGNTHDLSGWDWAECAAALVTGEEVGAVFCGAKIIPW